MFFHIFSCPQSKSNVIGRAAIHIDLNGFLSRSHYDAV